MIFAGAAPTRMRFRREQSNANMRIVNDYRRQLDDGATPARCGIGFSFHLPINRGSKASIGDPIRFLLIRLSKRMFHRSSINTQPSPVSLWSMLAKQNRYLAREALRMLSHIGTILSLFVCTARINAISVFSNTSLLQNSTIFEAAATDNIQCTRLRDSRCTLPVPCAERFPSLPEIDSLTEPNEL